MRFAYTREQRFAETGFAETGLAGQQKELSLSGDSEVQRSSSSASSASRPMKAAACRVAGGAETAGVVVCGEHLPRRNGVPKPFSASRFNRLEIEPIRDECTRAGGNDDAVARGGGLQARREVRGFAEHGKFGGGADRDQFADYDNAAGNADTTCEFDALDGSHGRHRGNNIERRRGLARSASSSCACG